MNAILFVALIVGGTALLSWPLGRYMKWAMDPNPISGRLCGPIRPAVRVFGRALHGDRQQNWKQYVVSMLVFNVLMFDGELRIHGAPAAFAAQSGRPEGARQAA